MNTYVRARIDEELKGKVEAICRKLGISVSDYIRLSFYQLAEEKKLPAGVLLPNKTTREAMEEAKAGKGKRYASKADMFKDLGL